jgi:creatinine amidohydrolase
MKEFYLDKMTWPDIKEGIDKIDAVLIPVGSTEQHGCHLPLGFDHFFASQICEKAAQILLEKKRWAVVAPTINYGCSWYHMNFPGTVSLSQSTFMTVVKEVCESLARHGFKHLIVVNGHAGNSAALMTCLTDLYAEKKIRVCLNTAAGAGSVINRFGIKSPLIHAEEVETSMAMALGVDVRMEALCRGGFDRREIHQSKGIPTSRHIAYDALVPGSGVFIPMDFIDDISDTGVVGDATSASEEKGRELVDAIVSTLVELVEDLSTTL